MLVTNIDETISFFYISLGANCNFSTQPRTYGPIITGYGHRIYFFCPYDAEFADFLMIHNDIFQFLIIFIKVGFQIKK